MTGIADKTAARTGLYRRTISEMQAAGRDRDALYEAIRWLRSEAKNAGYQRPRDAEALYRQLTDRIAALAEAIPAFRPAAPGRRHH